MEDDVLKMGGNAGEGSAAVGTVQEPVAVIGQEPGIVGFQHGRYEMFDSRAGGSFRAVTEPGTSMEAKKVRLDGRPSAASKDFRSVEGQGGSVSADHLAQLRRANVPPMLKRIKQAHEEASRDYRELADYRREFLTDLGLRRTIFMCTHGPHDPNALFGYMPGFYSIIKAAGGIGCKDAFRREIELELAAAQAAGQTLYVSDWVHPEDCAGLGGSTSLAHIIQDMHEEIIRSEFPMVQYTRGEICGPTADLKVVGRMDGHKTVFTTLLADKVVPPHLAHSDNHAIGYICRGLKEVGGFDHPTIYPMAQMLKANMDHKKQVGREQTDHQEWWGVTGRGLSWMYDSVFAVTASLENPYLLADAERSMLVGVPLIDEFLDEELPIVWACSVTYTASGSKKQSRREMDKAYEKADTLTKTIRSFPGLQPWLNKSRLVLVPAVVERDSSTLSFANAA